MKANGKSHCYWSGLWKEATLDLRLHHRPSVFFFALSSKLATSDVEVTSKGPLTSDSDSLKLDMRVQRMNVSSIFQHNRMQENALRGTFVNSSACLILLCIEIGLHFRLCDKFSFFNCSIFFLSQKGLTFFKSTVIFNLFNVQWFLMYQGASN